MGHQTADEALAENIKVMGEELGANYSALWQETAQLHMFWSEFVTLYGEKDSRVDILNRAAPRFFHMIQDMLWEATMLHISRLTDSPKSSGRANLTIMKLPDLISNADTRSRISSLAQAAKSKSAFCRDWRNRRLAHRDLNLALEQDSIPLEPATVKKTREAIEAIAATLNGVAFHFKDTETVFSHPSRAKGAVALLCILDDGIKADDARRERFKAGMVEEVDLRRSI